MAQLESLSSSEIKDALTEASGAKAVQRLMVAIAYKDGVAVSTLSDRYAVPESTIYYWFDRLESEPLQDAIEDETRPGRPPKLTSAERASIRTWLTNSPSEYGFDAEGWTPELLRGRIRDVYDVEYSLGHVRRMKRRLESNE